MQITLRFAALACAFALSTVPVLAQTAPPASPWTWPAIPPCLGDPSVSTPVSPKAPPLPPPAPGGASVCTLYASLLASPSIRILDLESARTANDAFAGVAYPAFLPGTAVLHFLVVGDLGSIFSGPNRLVRVSGSAGGAKYGSWWTTMAQVSGDGRTLRGVADVSNALALPSFPGCVAFGNGVTRGAQGYFGIVAKAFSQEGGAIELWFPAGAVTVDDPVIQLAGAPACQGLER